MFARTYKKRDTASITIIPNEFFPQPVPIHLIPVGKSSPCCGIQIGAMFTFNFTGSFKIITAISLNRAAL